MEKSNIHSAFKANPWKLCGSLAAKSYTVFTGQLLTLSAVWCWAGNMQWVYQNFFNEKCRILPPENGG